MAERSRALGEQGEWRDAENPPTASPYRDDAAQRVDAEAVAAMGIRRFVLNRMIDISGSSGVGVVAEGVRFSDGAVALHWMTELRSTAVYDSIDDLEAIHGHEGSTAIVWADA